MLPFPVPMELSKPIFLEVQTERGLSKFFAGSETTRARPALRNKNFAKYQPPTPPKLPPILTLTHLPQASATTLPFSSDPIPHREAYPCPAPPRLSAPSSDLAAEAARHGRRV
jgi:hypothetical protein